MLNYKTDSKVKRLALRLFYTLGAILFLIIETNGFVLVMKRHQLHLEPRILVFVIPFMLTIPLIVGLNAYMAMKRSGLDPGLLPQLKRVLFIVVAMAYGVLGSMMALLTNSLFLHTGR